MKKSVTKTFTLGESDVREALADYINSKNYQEDDVHIDTMNVSFDFGTLDHRLDFPIVKVTEEDNI